MKRTYQTPTILVVHLQQQCCLLAGSTEANRDPYGDAKNESWDYKKQTMKQYLYTIRIGVILLITTIFTACSNEDTATDNPFVANTYSLTINASKGEDDTRALSLDGTKLNATWTVDEAVTVYNNTKSAELSGTLKAKKAGSSTTLSGSLSGSIEVDDVLTLKFCSDNNYHSQGGTLDYIASHCDYATATVTVAAISGGNISINESAASRLS